MVRHTVTRADAAPAPIFGGLTFQNVPAAALPLLARFGYLPAAKPKPKAPSKRDPSLAAKQAENARRLARLKKGSK